MIMRVIEGYITTQYYYGCLSFINKHIILVKKSIKNQKKIINSRSKNRVLQGKALRIHGYYTQ